MKRIFLNKLKLLKKSLNNYSNKGWASKNENQSKNKKQILS